MKPSEHERTLHVTWPAHAVAPQDITPILFLADQMPDVPGEGDRESSIATLAHGLGLKGIRGSDWYASLDVETACARLRGIRGREAALVVLALVLRTDAGRSEAAAAYFGQVRDRLHMPALALPADEGMHRALAMAYLGMQP